MVKEIKELLRQGYNKVIESEHYWSEQSTRPELGIYKNFKRLVGNGKILELGCGPGTTLGTDLIDSSFDYLGVDISDANITKAKSWVKNGDQHFM